MLRQRQTEHLIVATRCTFWSLVGYLAALVISVPMPVHAAENSVRFEKREGVLAIRIDDMEVVSYVYRDKLIPRPYFAHVKTRDGIQVTRNHPPRAGQDATDHVGLHTGIWFSFGDLNGFDYWRLKARTEHVRFSTEPTGGTGKGRFTVLNRYLSTDEKAIVCEETCQYTIECVSSGYLLEIASEFRPEKSDLVFGDQEEMGLGIRVATPLAVDRKLGGRILDSAGRRNGAEVWGKTAEWCDYSGPMSNRWVGLTVLTGPENFRASWSHARDYGLLTMNPFGRHAFTKQEPSRVIIKPGELLRLQYGVVVHSSAAEADYKPEAAFRGFAKIPKPE
ncbi:MAG: hypothetical protein JWM11_2501 [Planctomycetaceae bacterium]|nr:hypothetical protein [Planctomycetaceae bacterium]